MLFKIPENLSRADIKRVKKARILFFSDESLNLHKDLFFLLGKIKVNQRLNIHDSLQRAELMRRSWSGGSVWVQRIRLSSKLNLQLYIAWVALRNRTDQKVFKSHQSHVV